jgi:predicted metalloprotease with PDZ domain
MKRLLVVVVATLTCGVASPRMQTASVRRLTGPIDLALDARETPRRILHAHESLPVGPGPLTLVYPKWLPGEHSPDGPIDDLVGLKFSAGGRDLPWRRDPADMYAFHLDVPQGTTALEASFDFLPAIGATGFSSAASDTAHLGIYSWNQVVLYPQGAQSDDVNVRASLQLPAGWSFGSAMQVASQSADRIAFAPVSLTTLVDSPILAGEHYRAVPLDSSVRPVEVDLAADSAASLAASPDLIENWKRLVREADAMFGARHFDRYHFLLTLSDRVAHFGLEHHQSNDSRVAENSVVTHSPSLGVMAHEYVHSWNGKFRRPAGLATPDFQQPMLGDLLWVYEGLTEYLGYVLAVRSGLWSDHFYRDELAYMAGYLDQQTGRRWRPLADTTAAAQLLYQAPGEWASYRRSVDFYEEGWLIWLEADTQIRQLTGGHRTLDDFCHLFYGGASGLAPVNAYTFDDVVVALNEVAPFDWKAFFTSRVYQVALHAPLGGVANAGWKVSYTNQPNEYVKFHEERLDLLPSLGLRLVPQSGTVTDVMLDSPAGKAGIGPGMQVVTVNGLRYSPDALKDAVAASRSAGPLRFDVQMDDVVKPMTVDYRGGTREPHLERDASRPDVLAEILASRAR